MKLRSIILAVFLLQSFYNNAWAEVKTGLIVTIDQQHIPNLKNNLLILNSTLDKSDTNSLGDLGAIIDKFKIKLVNKTLDEKLVLTAWDESRAEWIKEKSKNIYTNRYIVQGELVRDDNTMVETWKKALNENDIIDYVSMVHKGEQQIKEKWQLKTDGKLRMVYSEACQGGSGKEHFIEQYYALVSAGHDKEAKFASASPFFSFSFLSAWFSGSSFVDSLTSAWLKGSDLLQHNDQAFFLARLLGDYQQKEHAISGSKIQYSWHPWLENANGISLKTETGGYLSKDKAKEETLNL